MSNCQWEAQQAKEVGGCGNYTTQTNQFNHKEKNSGTYTKKMMHIQVTVRCESKETSCSLSHTLQPFHSFTAVSVHTVSEIHPWGDHRAQLKAHENAPQEINSKMSEELSVGKDTLVITTFQLCLLCSPSPSTPKMSQIFPQLKSPLGLFIWLQLSYFLRSICWYQ